MVVSRILRMFIVVAVLAATAAGQERSVSTAESKSAGVRITYLANEGIFIESGDESVLIDALFRSGVRGYATVEPATLRKMEQALAPFDDVDLALVTHIHADHFSADSVAAFLANSSTATLVTSSQVAEAIAQTTAYDRIEKKIKARDPAAQAKLVVDLGGVKVDVLKLSHGSGRFAKISNWGYIVQIGGKRILHLGDAHLGAASMAPLTAHAQDVDVACVPYWWLLESKGQVFVRDTLKAKNVIAFHIPPAEVEEVTATIHAAMPDVTIFGTPSQSQLF